MSFLSKFFNKPPDKVHEVPDDEIPPDQKKLLLLEDDGELTQVLKDYLVSSGYQVTAVKNGVEGLKHVMAADFDAILCDMMMPNLPGDMFYLAVERTKPHLCKRFIFMTGHRGDAKIDEFIRRVRGMMLWKPFEMHTLMDALQAVAKRR
ncbi:MAG: response regulator [Verrucomicrobia bacterium]|nr:response regulator [Verrucomicrobiota bacterium]